MRKLTTLLVTLLTSLLVASVIQASPVMGLQQLLGFGSTDVTTQQVEPRGYGPYSGEGGYDYGPYSTTESTTVKESVYGPHNGPYGPDSGYGYGPYGHK